MLQLQPAHTLSGGTLGGWLKARHHFRVGPDGNPAHGPLGALVMWNDDEIAPGTSFDLHPHAGLEIITHVRQGAVAHRNSTRAVGRIKAGDVQVMSAGTGIRHAESNDSLEPLKVFQIWIQPRHRDGEPRYACRSLPSSDRTGRLAPLASGLPGDDEALAICAGARVLGAALRVGDRVDHVPGTGRNVYLGPSREVVRVNGQRLAAGDGLAAVDESRLDIEAEEDTDLVLVDAA